MTDGDEMSGNGADRAEAEAAAAETLRVSVEALRAAEARFGAVTDLVPALLWSTDPGGAPVWHNRRWTEYTGQPPEPDGSGNAGWLEAIHPDDREEGLARLQEGLAAGVPWEMEQRIRRGSDGAYRWFRVRAEPLRDRAGRIAGWFGAATDVHEQREAREALEARVLERTEALAGSLEELAVATAERQALLRSLVAAQEEERGRVSRELHDETGQELTALLLGLQALRASVPPESLAALERLEELTRNLAEKIHRTAVRLRPTALDDIGLPGALAGLVEQWSERSTESGGPAAEFEAVGFESSADRLPGDVETTIYRVVQEALTNVLRHASGTQPGGPAAATRVSVVVHRRGDIDVATTVEDDGPGFDVREALQRPAPGSPAGPGVGRRLRLGLLGIRERAGLVGGTVEIESEPGKGTSVFLRIPLGGPAPIP